MKGTLSIALVQFLSLGCTAKPCLLKLSEEMSDLWNVFKEMQFEYS